MPSSDWAVCWVAPLSDLCPTPRQTIFVGGPGRSGTSFVADRLGAHPDVCTLPNVELKLFTEKNGLIDLFHALVEVYSPNRATVAVDQFRRFYLALVEGRFGQPGLEKLAARQIWLEMLDTFVAVLSRDGHAGPAAPDEFYAAARNLLWGIANVAAQLKSTEKPSEAYLEKTPHALLSIDFLARVAPGARFVHVMRDPRSIAFSLRRMRWGPNTLEGCCAWVDHYCQAWLATQSRAARLGLQPINLRIEAVAGSPEFWSERICQALDLHVARSLFVSADVETLNSWVSKAEPDELRLLDDRLQSWAHHFGYRAIRAGELESSMSS